MEICPICEGISRIGGRYLENKRLIIFYNAVISVEREGVSKRNRFDFNILNTMILSIL